MQTTSLRERQLHMTQLLKKLDRMIVEKHGRFNLPFYHYQRPLAAPGERDSVCVYVDSVKREYLPYGTELEKLVDDARLWVRTGEGPRPEVMISRAQAADGAKVSNKEKGAAEGDGAAEPREALRTSGSRRKLMNMRETVTEKAGSPRARPPR